MIMKKQRFKSISDEIKNRNDIISFLDSSENIEKLFDIPSSISNDRLLLYKKLYTAKQKHVLQKKLSKKDVKILQDSIIEFEEKTPTEFKLVSVYLWLKQEIEQNLV